MEYHFAKYHVSDPKVGIMYHVCDAYWMNTFCKLRTENPELIEALDQELIRDMNLSYRQLVQAITDPDEFKRME